jgi:hypothetical protein
MLGVRNNGIILSSRWTKTEVSEIVKNTGHFNYCPMGNYGIGCDARTERNSPTRSLLHAPAPRDKVLIPGFYYMKRALIFSELIKIVILTNDSIKIFSQKDIVPQHSGYLEGSMFMSLLGWRCITEQEWEAVVFRQNHAMNSFVSDREFQKFTRKCIKGTRNQVRIHEEWTSSLGYAMDVSEWGSNAEECLPNSSWFRWPGVIVRGWRSDYAADPRSRLSVRHVGQDILFRPVIEESMVNEMDASPMKSYLMGRKKRLVERPPGIHIGMNGVIK